MLKVNFVIYMGLARRGNTTLRRGLHCNAVYFLLIYISFRGLRVYPYPRIYPYPTRTRGSGTGRVRSWRVRVGSGRQSTGTGIPDFTREKGNLTDE